MQKVNYKYNIRGWLTHINSLNHLEEAPGQFADLFAFKINYDIAEYTDSGNIQPLYNGNISETFWQTESDATIRKYGYKYDQLNRLQKAVYQKPYESTPITNSYNESLFYDKNGNITALQRSGEVDDYNFELVIDNLTYTYHNINKNQLTIVYDATNNPNGFADDAQGTPDTTVDYGYDVYGNMTYDTNKGMTASNPITYNNLNLPIKITFPNGIIEYLYNAAGVKVQKKVTIGSTITLTDYQSGYQYKDGQLLFFPHAEGYVNVVEGNYFNYVYNYTDHLGNIRVSYGLDPQSNALKILEENHYYPFGLKHKNYNMDIRTYNRNNLGLIVLPLAGDMSYKYKYNGKEFQDELGLNFYDYGARNYDAAIGRWNGIDLLAEKYHPLSPYCFVANDPVKYKDVQGMDIVDKRGGSNELIIIDENGQLQWTEHASSKRNSGAIQVLTEMLKTDKGRQIVMNLVKSDTKTNIDLIETSTNNSDFFIIDNKLKIALGYTDYTGSNILVDGNGMPYFNNATVNIYSSSFKIMNGDKSSLPKWAKDKELSQNVEMELYEDFGKFLNGVGTHEGTHVLNDLAEAMSDLGIDKITVKGNDAKKLFQSLISSLNKMNQSKDAPLEEVPLQNEQESNNQYK